MGTFGQVHGSGLVPIHYRGYVKLVMGILDEYMVLVQWKHGCGVWFGTSILRL